MTVKNDLEGIIIINKFKNNENMEGILKALDFNMSGVNKLSDLGILLKEILEQMSDYVKTKGDYPEKEKFRDILNERVIYQDRYVQNPIYMPPYHPNVNDLHYNPHLMKCYWASSF